MKRSWIRAFSLILALALACAAGALSEGASGSPNIPIGGYLENYVPERDGYFGLIPFIVPSGDAAREGDLAALVFGGQIYVDLDGLNGALEDFYVDIIADELNVKSVEFTDDVSAFTNYSFKPQLRTLGRRFGKNINEVKTILANIDGVKAMAELRSTGKLTINVAGVDEALAEEDLLIESAQMEGYVSDSDQGITVVLDTNLTPELVEEGFVREIISKVQTMRKSADFEVTDHIHLFVKNNQKVADVVYANAETIQAEVLADEISVGETDGFVQDWNINGEEVTFGVAKL